MTAKKKQLLMIGATVLVLLVIAGIMLIIGRGHTIYFDNKEFTYNGAAYSAPYKVEVYVNGEQAAKLYDKERGMAKWIGQSFNMKLVITDAKGGAEREMDAAFELPYDMDGITVNLPAIIAGLPIEAHLAEFEIVAVEEPEDDAPVDDLGGLGVEDVPVVEG